jgi:hypothetical protein
VELGALEPTRVDAIGHARLREGTGGHDDNVVLDRIDGVLRIV